MAQENRSRATNAKPAQDVSAGSLKSAPILSQPSQEMAVHLWRIEDLLDRVIRSLDVVAGAL